MSKNRFSAKRTSLGYDKRDSESWSLGYSTSPSSSTSKQGFGQRRASLAQTPKIFSDAYFPRTNKDIFFYIDKINEHKVPHWVDETQETLVEIPSEREAEDAALSELISSPVGTSRPTTPMPHATNFWSVPGAKSDLANAKKMLEMQRKIDALESENSTLR